MSEHDNDNGTPDPQWQGGGSAPWAPPPGPKRGMSTPAKVAVGCVVGVVGAVLVALIFAVAATIVGTPALDAAKPTTPPAAGPSRPATPPTVTSVPEGPTAALADSFSNGTYTAGEDVTPGRYKSTGVDQTTQSGVPMCAWSVSRDGTPVDGAVTDAGRPTVRLRSGDEIQSTGCGTFELVR